MNSFILQGPLLAVKLLPEPKTIRPLDARERTNHRSPGAFRCGGLQSGDSPLSHLFRLSRTASGVVVARMDELFKIEQEARQAEGVPWVLEKDYPECSCREIDAREILSMKSSQPETTGDFFYVQAC
jgi:hypothetical protein